MDGSNQIYACELGRLTRELITRYAGVVTKS